VPLGAAVALLVRYSRLRDSPSRVFASHGKGTSNVDLRSCFRDSRLSAIIFAYSRSKSASSSGSTSSSCRVTTMCFFLGVSAWSNEGAEPPLASTFFELVACKKKIIGKTYICLFLFLRFIITSASGRPVSISLSSIHHRRILAVLFFRHNSFLNARVFDLVPWQAGKPC
jgi:hypothetical protein